MLVFIIFSVSISSAPGYVGTFHGFVIAILLFMGVGGRKCRKGKYGRHACIELCSVTIIGLYYLWSSNFTLKLASDNAVLTIGTIK